MSINHEIILRDTTHKNRAINMLTGFTAVFMACSFALIGNQYVGVLGFEWLVLWLIATGIFIGGYVRAIRSGMSSIGLSTPRLAGGTICYLAEVIGAIFLILATITAYASNKSERRKLENYDVKFAALFRACFFCTSIIILF
jgi:hypothetical protein